MSKADLLILPVKELSTEQSFLGLWATNSKDRKTGEPMLKMAFDWLDCWGVTFYTLLIGHKKTGPCPFGPYQIITEHVLFAYREKCHFSRSSFGKL